MAAFGRRNLPAARAFVDSVYSRGGAITGRGARHPSSWSDAYTIRVANAWQRSAAAGRPLSLQEARRGPAFTARVRAEQAQAAARGKRLPGGLEHPRERWVGPRTGPRARPDEQGSAGFYAKQYRQARSAARYIARSHAERVQVIAYGTPATGYSGDQRPAWRVLFTGPRDRAIDEWDRIGAGVHGDDGSPNAGVPVFDHVERFEVRHGPGIG